MNSELIEKHPELCGLSEIKACEEVLTSEKYDIEDKSYCETLLEGLAEKNPTAKNILKKYWKQ